MDKKLEAYKTIGEVAKSVGLIGKNGSLSTHTLRFWQKEFKQIKPKIFSGRRRYYTNKDIRVIKVIKYLLKEKGMTIKGVKSALSNPNSLMLDGSNDNSISTDSLDKKKLRTKLGKYRKL